MEKEVKSFVVSQKVMDIAVSTLVQLLEEMGVLTPGEFKERAAKTYRDTDTSTVSTEVKNK